MALKKQSIFKVWILKVNLWYSLIDINGTEGLHHVHVTSHDFYKPRQMFYYVLFLKVHIIIWERTTDDWQNYKLHPCTPSLFSIELLKKKYTLIVYLSFLLVCSMQTEHTILSLYTEKEKNLSTDLLPIPTYRLTTYYRLCEWIFTYSTTEDYILLPSTILQPITYFTNVNTL